MDILGSGHEQVVFCSDRESGLRAVIAIHSTALGPALGGTRFYPYASEDDAVADALRLSRAMSYKNSLAGLDLGGGKAVIIGNPRTDKSEALLRAYGRRYLTAGRRVSTSTRFALGGRYLTACDVGTFNADLDVVAGRPAGGRRRRFARPGGGPVAGRCGWSPTPPRSSARRTTSTRRARWAGRWTPRPWPRRLLARGSPTTWSPAASSTPLTTW
ncbi:hypothetical protein JKP75_17430 [Blastococcus sp. TML/M2B]|uniref:Glu/Leu/Phe/Val dehydrogenase dimerization domain-containing protein n=1 Tax=Blastococcus sp. TML/M2B TaxID=2798727 RepID=UPI00190CA676|nr:Glu/Leu/Phe/Val dehydrogenase dimerization domain-containing protein [Blastococcus sp. TML/M2B]MBN1094177.1 hypothetical protein [Blastococcus sp. TML/M2B]